MKLSRCWLIPLVMVLCAPVSAWAQTGAQAGVSPAGTTSSEDRAIAEKMLGIGGRLTPDRVRNQCANPTRRGEIVVCAPKEEANRLPKTGDSVAEQSLNDGRLHTPDVGGNGIFKGKATKSGMCMIPPCPPEQPYIIDLSSIPQAPAGSDADKIAKGELRAP